MNRVGAAVIMSLLIGLPAGGVAAATVHCSPETVFVDSAEVFQVSVMVEDLDTLSNFQVIFKYDCTVLEFIDAYEGSLYANSGLQTWFTVEEESTGTWEVWDVIFPALTYLLPPGELCKLEFRGLGTGHTPIEFLSVALTDRYREAITPVSWTDGHVFVGDFSGVYEGDAGPGGDQFRIGMPWPNPARGGTDIRAQVTMLRERAEPDIAIYDSLGRVVARPDVLCASTGGVLVWNGRDAAGRNAPAGVYYIRAGGHGAAAARKVVLIR
jgi:hypothetical protein